MISNNLLCQDISAQETIDNPLVLEEIITANAISRLTAISIVSRPSVQLTSTIMISMIIIQSQPSLKPHLIEAVSTINSKTIKDDDVFAKISLWLLFKIFFQKVFATNLNFRYQRVKKWKK